MKFSDQEKEVEETQRWNQGHEQVIGLEFPVASTPVFIQSIREECDF